ncbi:MAG: hypothetical protein Q8916_08415 [Bacteroidota bacterium]|nr:hypothetical protein [Bacteroidota bacterium]
MIVRHIKKFEEIFYTDLSSLYPEESISAFGSLERAEQFYLQQEKTQGMVKRIIEESTTNPLDPIEVVTFSELSIRDADFQDRIQELQFTIDNGNHRYFAYLQANVLTHIPVRLRIVEK